MLRGKGAIIRIACVSVLSVIVCAFVSIIHLSSPSALSLWNNFRQAPLPNTSRVCPDPNNPKYFEELAESARVRASKQRPLFFSSACHYIQKKHELKPKVVCTLTFLHGALMLPSLCSLQRTLPAK
jgi:hypothetical protein